MGYPTLESDLLIHTDRKEFKLYTEKVLIENLETMDTSIEVSVAFVENNAVPVSKAYKDFLIHYKPLKMCKTAVRFLRISRKHSRRAYRKFC